MSKKGGRNRNKDQFKVHIPSDDERHQIVMDKIRTRAHLIPDIQNLEINDKKLFDFLYHFEDHGWAIYHVYDDDMINDLLEEANQTLKKKYPNFDMTKQESYGNFPFDSIGFIELYHLRNLYKMRFYEPMVKLFQTLHNTEDIRVLIDRMGFKRSLYQIFNDKVTERKDFAHNGFLHHDMNLITGFTPNPIQCVVALNDTDENMGGWQGIDYFHYNAKQWASECKPTYVNKLNSSYAKIPIMIPDGENWTAIHPPMKKGDILVWKSETAHGNGSNLNKMGLPRMAAYINYVPAEHEAKHCSAIRVDQIQCFMTGKHPKNYPEKHANLEVQDYVPYPLNELGEKLMGFA
jgi:hypothetical protein